MNAHGASGLLEHTRSFLREKRTHMRSTLKQFGWLAASVLLLVCSASDAVFAQGTPPAPEIDGATITTGLGLLGAGLMMLRARRNR